MSREPKSRRELHGSGGRSRKSRRQIQEQKQKGRKRQQTRGQERKAPRKKKRRSSWRTWVGVLLILFALVLFSLDPIKNYMIKRAQETNTIGNYTRADIEANEQVEADFDFSQIEQLDALTVIRENVNPKDLPIVGAIAIPSLDMNLPIYKGASNANMYLGAGTLFEDQKMGESNYPIASHHSIHEDLLFAPLLHIEMGADVYLTDLKNVYHYKVDFNEHVPAERVDLIELGEKNMVTMVTCDYDLVGRVVVQAAHVETIPVEKASKEIVDLFGAPQTVPE